jgi:hypothetical protein
MSKQAKMMMGLLALALAVPALGQVPTGRQGPFRPHPFKERQCVAQCRQDELACLKNARDTAAPCFAGCKALVDAAHTACNANPNSDACTTAAAAARACLDPCNAMFRPAAYECKEVGRECVRACPFIGEPPCLAACRADYVHCLADTRDALNDCRKGCDGQFNAARTACASAPQSDACKAARDALNTCLAPCRMLVKQDLDKCGTTLGQCVQGCPDGGQTTN